MKRLGGTVTFFVFCTAFVPFLMEPGAADAKSRAKSPTAKITTPIVVPLPERNPNRPAAALPESGALAGEAPASTEADASTEATAPAQEKALASETLASETTGAVKEAKLTPSSAPEPQAAESDAGEAGDAAPVPERNPERPTETLAIKGPFAASSTAAPAKKPDYTAILKPLLFFDHQVPFGMQNQ
jgi:hypothetical protein